MGATEQKNYKVLSITELSRMGETNKVEKFYRFQIKSAGGVILTQDIDKDDFTPEKAAPILSTTAKNADAMLKG